LRRLATPPHTLFPRAVASACTDGFALARSLSGGTDVPILNLSSEQAETLAQVLEDYVSDLRMEVANTDSQEFRDDLKKKELFLKDLLSQLGRTATSAS
jgi:LPS O-antigen subunit length determinant protein (WzzB/FepE family)